jgi:hypothetical protein
VNNVTIIDTDLLIDAGRDIHEAIEFLERLGSETPLAISVITQMELIVGCQSKQELRSVEKFLSRFEIISLNEQISKLAVDLFREYRFIPKLNLLAYP